MIKQWLLELVALNEDVTNVPFAFHGDRAYFRQYDGTLYYSFLLIGD